MKVPDDAQKGEPDVVVANVVHPDLNQNLGQETVDIDFDMAVWPPVISTSEEVTVFLRADVRSRDGMSTSNHSASPVLLRFASGDGHVVYSPWRHTANDEGDSLEVIRYMFSQITAEQ